MRSKRTSALLAVPPALVIGLLGVRGSQSSLAGGSSRLGTRSRTLRADAALRADATSRVGLVSLGKRSTDDRPTSARYGSFRIYR